MLLPGEHGACSLPSRRGPGVAGSRAHGPVTGMEREQAAQAGPVVPTQGTGSFLHPAHGAG